jgi:heme/copper-type cytochrome/quinol oxidase subunit 2
MIKNIKAKMNFSDKDKTILSVNHNYYVRTAIATLADMFLTLIILLIIAAVVTGGAVLFLVSNEGSDEKVKTNATVFAIAATIDVLLAVFYFFYVIVKIARISKERKHVNRIEKEIIKSCTVGEDPEAEAAPAAE